MEPAQEIEDALGDLAAQPDDDALRARAATALTAAGRHREAVEILRDGLINLTAHDGPTLPCLCARCLRPELVHAEAEQMSFTRGFVVARGRVLYYWAPDEIADDPGLLRAVAAQLSRRLVRRA
ncbi:hypothetical protein ENSA5_69570 [Enhygromyxa salina]|uniref:Uncharacterized protein n=1 Tax=Enhygromyxa salina TaxID=215803 RepID=A0A2S9XB43_9BACT|nr:hypothetical protein [Enhygromyxa salina]PRP89921.1 hypothetical protein ENSA5_69570 [Enhygromyxa salina]